MEKPVRNHASWGCLRAVKMRIVFPHAVYPRTRIRKIMKSAICKVNNSSHNQIVLVSAQPRGENINGALRARKAGSNRQELWFMREMVPSHGRGTDRKGERSNVLLQDIQAVTAWISRAQHARIKGPSECQLVDKNWTGICSIPE